MDNEIPQSQRQVCFSHPSWKSRNSFCRNEKPAETMVAKVNEKWVSSGEAEVQAEVQESRRIFTVEHF